MRLKARVHPGAQETRVVQGELLEVWVKAKPDKDKANRAVLRAVAESFFVPTSRVRILKGHASRKKLLKVDI